jgi:hypothetical protein
VRGLGIVGTLTAALVVAAVAAANGGGNLTAAPIVMIGQQEFGSTTDGYYRGSTAADYWKVPLIAADKVTIDWESNNANACSETAEALYLWPIGTTDFSINNVSPLGSWGVGSNSKQEETFTASDTGVFAIMFEGCGDRDHGGGGAYDFTVYVKHKLVTHLSAATTALIARGRSSGLPRRGGLAVQVFTGDGKPVADGGVGGTLTGYWGAAWHPLGKAVARGGTVSVRYALPASAQTPIRLQLNIGGGSYQGVRLRYVGLKA